jgi:hypothetical protein
MSNNLNLLNKKLMEECTKMGKPAMPEQKINWLLDLK